MYKRIKSVSAILLCLAVIVIIFSGCGSKDKKIDLIYPIEGNMTSFDPQVASTEDDFLLCENIYEGLVRVDDKGEVTPGMAESWEVTNNGLTYTFHLKKGCKWHINDTIKERMGENFNPDVVADDFVFALQRAVDPNTNSPLYSTVSSIKNASAINAGKKDVSELGVKAVDNYTLVIELESAVNGFLNVLSTAVSAPCNRQFFNATKGRYGLELKYSMFNGQFIVSKVLDKSINLIKNETYNGPSPAKADKLTFSITDDREKIVENLASGVYDAAFLSGHETKSIGKKSKISTVPYTDTMWGFVFNCSDSIVSNLNIRKSLCLSFGNANLEKADYLTKATGYIPPSCTIGNEPYRNSAADTYYQQDVSTAVELWKKGLKELKVSSATLTVITTKEMEEYVKEVFQDVQASIGKTTGYGSGDNKKEVAMTMKIEIVEESDLKSRIAKGDYQIAFTGYKAHSSNPFSFIENIMNNSKYATAGSSEFSDKISVLSYSAGKNGESNFYSKCESELLATYSVCPVFFETSYYASAENVSGIQFHAGSGRVNFCNATRKD